MHARELQQGILVPVPFVTIMLLLQKERKKGLRHSTNYLKPINMPRHLPQRCNQELVLTSAPTISLTIQNDRENKVWWLETVPTEGWHFVQWGGGREPAFPSLSGRSHFPMHFTGGCAFLTALLRLLWTTKIFRLCLSDSIMEGGKKEEGKKEGLHSLWDSQTSDSGLLGSMSLFDVWQIFCNKKHNSVFRHFSQLHTTFAQYFWDIW